MAEGSSSNAAVWLISVPLARIPRGLSSTLVECLIDTMTLETGISSERTKNNIPNTIEWTMDILIRHLKVSIVFQRN